MAVASQGSEAAVVRAPAGGGTLTRLGRLIREVARRPAGLFGLLVVCLLFVVVVAAPVVAPYSPYDQSIVERLQGPSLKHLLGTDELGRDLLSRVIFGARIALGVAIPAVLIAMFVGMLTGLISGYMGRSVDQVAIVGMDAIQAFPRSSSPWPFSRSWARLCATWSSSSAWRSRRAMRAWCAP